MTKGTTRVLGWKHWNKAKEKSNGYVSFAGWLCWFLCQLKLLPILFRNKFILFFEHESACLYIYLATDGVFTQFPIYKMALLKSRPLLSPFYQWSSIDSGGGRGKNTVWLSKLMRTLSKSSKKRRKKDCLLLRHFFPPFQNLSLLKWKWSKWWLLHIQCTVTPTKRFYYSATPLSWQTLHLK